MRNDTFICARCGELQRLWRAPLLLADLILLRLHPFLRIILDGTVTAPAKVTLSVTNY